jgi:hypothetical protein
MTQAMNLANFSNYLDTSGQVAPTVLNAAIPLSKGGTALTTTPSNGQLLIGNGAGYTFGTITAGSNITVTNGSGTITIAGNAGTVTSVAASVPAFLSISGTPITSTGTLAITYSGTALPVANGGTGLTSSGTSGNILTSNGTAWVSTANSIIGVGQSWQNVTSSRAWNTVYTNSTTKPIMVSITPNNTGSGSTVFYTVDGVIIGQGNGDSTNGGTTYPFTFIVPVGSTYKVSGTRVLGLWAELR